MRRRLVQKIGCKMEVEKPEFLAPLVPPAKSFRPSGFSSHLYNMDNSPAAWVSSVRTERIWISYVPIYHINCHTIIEN